MSLNGVDPDLVAYELEHVAAPCATCVTLALDARSVRKLYISLNTVKAHTRELDRKLDASSGKDAIARAEALGLLDLIESPG